jgi:subtilisin-like proprotein convertase family protein
MRRLLVLLILPLLFTTNILADDGLRLELTRQSLTATWRYYAQIVDGLEVEGAGVIERVDHDGSVHEVYRELAAPQARVPRRMIAANEATRAVPSGLLVDEKMVALNDHGTARPVWRVVVEESLHKPYAHYVDASTGELLRSEPLFSRVQARVFDINPVAKLNRPDLADNNGLASAVPDAAYSIVELDNLPSSGPLAGPYVAIMNLDDPVTTPADASQPLLFDRSQPQFQEVNAYFQLDRAQKYLLSLGYIGVRRLINYQLPCDPHALNGDDNSYYLRGAIPGQGQLLFGDGGTDDAEDSDIILHEFGHVIQDWIAPATFTGPSSTQPPAIGEGFADYWSFSQTYTATAATGRDPFCIADWDARCGGDDASQRCSYPVGADCLRRVDGTKTMADYIQSDNSGTEHLNGEIWSSALREIFMSMTARVGLDAGKRMADTTIIEGTFGVPPGPTYATMAKKLLQADAALNGSANAQTICTAMTARGILQAADCSLSPHGELTVIPPSDQGGAIPDDTTAGITLSAVVTDGRTIDKLFVDVDIQHTSRGDLQLTLIGPDGTRVFLQQPSLDRTPDVRATFGLDAPTVNSLDVFHGQPAAGVWKLFVQDLRPHDSGFVRSWSLRIQFAGDTPSSTRPASFAARKFIPAVAHAAGANGTNFISDVYLFNRGSQATETALVFTPSGQDGWSNFAAVHVELAPGQAATLSDIVGHTMETTGTGNLDVVGDAGSLIVTSRTYTAPASGGTYGQSIPAITTDGAAVIGGVDTPGAIAGLRNDADFRTNIGLSEVAGGSGVVRITYFDASGAQIGQNDVTVLPFMHTQMPVPLATAARAALSVLSGDARPVGYASIVDNHSGDAVYLEAVPHSPPVLVPPPPVHPLLFVPAISSVGVNGTTWQTELTVANTLDFPTELDAELEPGHATLRFPLAAGQTLRIDDLLHGQFGSSGLALIALLPGDGAFLASHTWTTSGSGSYGVGIPPIGASTGTALGRPPLNIAHLESSRAFRSNIGLVETSGVGLPATLRIIVYDSADNELARQDVALPAGGITQVPLSSLVSGDVYGGRASVEVVAGSGVVFVYGSIVDNVTGDPIYIAGQ